MSTVPCWPCNPTHVVFIVFNKCVHVCLSVLYVYVSAVCVCVVLSEHAEAEEWYTSALGGCPVCYSKERAVLFSNRAAARLHLVMHYAP